MKKYLSTVLLILIATITISARDNESRTVPPFQGILLKIDATIHLKQSKEQSVKIVTEKPGVTSKINTIVKNDQLEIKVNNSDKWFKDWESGKIDIYISVPYINYIEISGNGKIEAMESLDARIIDLKVKGAGELSFDNLTTEKLSLYLSGAGKINIDGPKQVSKINYFISGSGTIQTDNLKATQADITLSGSGSCHLTAEKFIKVRTSGSGNVYYHGNPAVDSKILGSGSVIQQN